MEKQKFSLLGRPASVIILLSLTLSAFADNNKPAKPAPHAAAAPAAAVHAPATPANGQAGAHALSAPAGAHTPAGASGAHVPSNVAGAHVPSNVPGAHTPTNVSAAHTTGHATTMPHAGAAGPHGVAHAATMHAATAHAAGVHAAAYGHVGGPVVGQHMTREAQISHAQEHREVAHEHEFVRAHEHDFHSRNVREFNERERMAWRGGRWRNDWHYGRYGWWFLVGGVWYEYERPVYPYPMVVAPLVVYETPVVATSLPTYWDSNGGAGYVPREGAIARLPSVPPGTYHCASPVSDYPVVGTCATGWVFVPDPQPMGQLK